MSAVIHASVQMELSAPASARLHAEMTPQAAVQELLDAGQPQDALKLLARLLPKRYAVAWLCQCARDQPLTHEDRSGAALAEKWVRNYHQAMTVLEEISSINLELIRIKEPDADQ